MEAGDNFGSILCNYLKECFDVFQKVKVKLDYFSKFNIQSFVLKWVGGVEEYSNIPICRVAAQHHSIGMDTIDSNQARNTAETLNKVTFIVTFQACEPYIKRRAK